jgi:hypothetical protein
MSIGARRAAPSGTARGAITPPGKPPTLSLPESREKNRLDPRNRRSHHQQRVPNQPLTKQTPRAVRDGSEGGRSASEGASREGRITGRKTAFGFESIRAMVTKPIWVKYSPSAPGPLEQGRNCTDCRGRNRANRVVTVQTPGASVQLSSEALCSQNCCIDNTASEARCSTKFRQTRDAADGTDNHHRDGLRPRPDHATGVLHRESRPLRPPRAPCISRQAFCTTSGKKA